MLIFWRFARQNLSASSEIQLTSQKIQNKQIDFQISKWIVNCGMSNIILRHRVKLLTKIQWCARQWNNLTASASIFKKLKRKKLYKSGLCIINILRLVVLLGKTLHANFLTGYLWCGKTAPGSVLQRLIYRRKK